MLRSRRAVLLALATALVVALAPPRAARAQQFQDYGVVFLHGKGMWPGAFDGGLLGSLESQGAKTATPEMPWSFSRIYAATYAQAMSEIDMAVASLKARGAKKIILIGHSLGANAAIGYAATRGPLAAVIALAPGHLPETEGLRGRTRTAIVEATQLIANGQGDVRHSFPDQVQGFPTVVSATPFVYLSMFDPNGPAVMPKNAAAMPPVPFLWVAGIFDPIYSRGRDYAFTLGAKHPKSRYLEVLGGHLSAPLLAHGKIMDWLNSLDD